METLTLILYVLWILKVFQWAASLTFYWGLPELRKSVTVFKLTWTDHILWVVPIIFFNGGIR